ncbi:hypothetical protein PAAG_11405 [Paracoccidioides lutzii Pb01]|uniref:Uncharacterized protein n=1 Tax=Paracoccidioides lutzii (strain ATCC MYA-826 / Pb01) TaxID=502779 RepID=A0A0A2V6T9_PARBA|nr:hypothetical protein PAAG_11405 [Paracoccidioides lutzii Pb01]KGQ01830.1 hypothetical protein PAAG_11405 [Paracoccidioides lutzii Pb01]
MAPNQKGSSGKLGRTGLAGMENNNNRATSSHCCPVPALLLVVTNQQLRAQNRRTLPPYNFDPPTKSFQSLPPFAPKPKTNQPSRKPDPDKLWPDHDPPFSTLQQKAHFLTHGLPRIHQPPPSAAGPLLDSACACA